MNHGIPIAEFQVSKQAMEMAAEGAYGYSTNLGMCGPTIPSQPRPNASLLRRLTTISFSSKLSELTKKVKCSLVTSSLKSSRYHAVHGDLKKQLNQSREAGLDLPGTAGGFPTTSVSRAIS